MGSKFNFSRNRFILSVVCNDFCEIAESFASAMILRGHYVRVFNDHGETRAMCHGCFTLNEIMKYAAEAMTIYFAKPDLSHDSSFAHVQICINDPMKLFEVIWNSKTSLLYDYGLEKAIERFESHRWIPFLYHGTAIQTSREKILVLGDKLGLDNEESFDFDELNRAKVVIVNSRNIIIGNFRGFHVLKILNSGIPVIVYRLTELEEFVEDGISGFVVDSEEQIIEVLNNLDNLDVKIKDIHSPINICKLYEAFFSDIFALENNKLGYIDNFVVGDVVDSPKDGLNYSMYPGCVWSPEKSDELASYWAIISEKPVRIDSISRLIEAYGITQINTLRIAKFNFDEKLVIKDIFDAKIKPSKIVFDEPFSENLASIGYMQLSSRVFVFPQPKVIAYSFPSCERLARGIYDLLKRSRASEAFVFEQFDKKKEHEYFKIITSGRVAKIQKKLYPEKIYGIDLRAFPRKFFPKSLRVVGIMTKPKMKIIGKMVDGKLCPVERSENEDCMDTIIGTIREKGLHLKYIEPSTDPARFDVTFELYRHMDLLIYHKQSAIGQCAIEAACCGIPVISYNADSDSSFMENMLKFRTKEDLSDVFNYLIDDDNFVGYRDRLHEAISSKFDIEKLNLSFLK